MILCDMEFYEQGEFLGQKDAKKNLLYTQSTVKTDSKIIVRIIATK